MPPPPGTPHRVLRVVVADDDRLFARMLRMRLNALPEIEVVGIAGNGHEALELVEEFEPDVVLMDVEMPVMDGVEATARIRDLDNAPSVVLITGGAGETDASAYEAGATAYLRKTGDLIPLFDVILALSQLPRIGV